MARPSLLPVPRREPLEVLIVDLDRARAGTPPSLGRRAREIARLDRSLHKHGLQIGASTNERFLDAYVDGDAGARARLRRRLRFASVRTVVHRAGYAARATSKS